MYYLWKAENGVFYLTDYKKVRNDGKVKIDNYGYLEVKEIFSSNKKSDLIIYAQKLTN